MDVFPHRHHRGRSIISVTGEIDLATVDDLLSRLIGLIGPAPRDIGLDLSGVTFIDCMGLRALFAVNAHIRANGADLKLTAVSSAVVRLLELVNANCDSDPPPSAPMTAVTAPTDVTTRLSCVAA